MCCSDGFECSTSCIQQEADRTMPRPHLPPIDPKAAERHEGSVISTDDDVGGKKKEIVWHRIVRRLSHLMRSNQPNLAELS